MRIKLLDFQRQAATEVLEQLDSGIHSYRSTRSKARPAKLAFALSSVTGSGKTVIAANVVEALLRGSADFGIQPVPDLAVLWVTYDPSLGTQTRRSFANHADRLDHHRLKTISSESFNETELAPGNVYFLSLPLLGGSNRLTRTTDGRGFTFWDTLRETVANPDTTLLVIVDEAHVGAGKSTPKSELSILQRVLAGDQTSGYPGAPLVWGISATPHRFDATVKSLLTGSSGENVVVRPADVQASGLLKQAVSLYIPDEKASMSVTMLNQGLAQRQHAEAIWADYCSTLRVTEQEQAGDEESFEPTQTVVPLMVFQLPDRPEGGSKAEENRLIRDLVKYARVHMPDLQDKHIKHVIGDRGAIKVGSLSIEKVDPNLVQSLEDIRLLVVKDAVSTGWDCPRAEVLVSMRRFTDATAITQMLGRMVRTPLARSTGNEELDRVCCWVPFFDKEQAVHVIEVLTGEVEPDGRQKAPIQTDLNPMVFTRTDLDTSTDEEGGQVFDPLSVTDEQVGQMQVSDDDLDMGDEEVLGGELDEQVEIAEDRPVADQPRVAVTTTQPAGGQETGRTPVERPTAAALAAVEALVTMSLPRRTSNPVRRAQEVAVLLNDSGVVAGAGRQFKDAMVDYLRGAQVQHEQAVNKARLDVLTASQVRIDGSFGNEQVFRQLDVKAGLDAVTSEFEAADRRLGGMGKELYGRLSRRQAGADPQGSFDELELRADVAALGLVDEVVQGMTDAADRWAEAQLRQHRDEMLNQPLEVQRRFEDLRLQSNKPVAQKLSVPAQASGSSVVRQDAVWFPKHLISGADGWWPQTGLNRWEKAVLDRELERDAVVAWYRNPSHNGTKALSIAYKDGASAWRTTQPDFLFVEKAADGTHRVSIVDPHWTADADALVRLRALADYATEHAEKLVRVNPVTSLRGQDTLRRLSLQDPDVREAVHRATSVEELFASEVAEDYPVTLSA